MEPDEEKCEKCGLPTPSSELELWDGLCSLCAGLQMRDDQINRAVRECSKERNPIR